MEILLRNGIGNKTELSNLNINLVKDVPGVGRNLIDHVSMPVTFKTNEKKWESVDNSTNNFKSFIEYSFLGK